MRRIASIDECGGRIETVDTGDRCLPGCFESSDGNGCLTRQWSELASGDESDYYQLIAVATAPLPASRSLLSLGLWRV